MGNISSRADDVRLQQQIIEALEQNQVALFKSLVSNALPSSEDTRKKASRIYLRLAAIHNVDALEWLTNYVSFVPDEADENGRNLLHFAAKEGCLQSIAYLVEKLNCNIEAEDIEGYTPFLYAVNGGHFPCVKYLATKMDQKLVPVQALKDGRTSIHICAQEGHLVVLRWLVDTYPSIQTDRIDKTEGMTPFHVAARFGRATILDFLLRHCNIDPNAVDSNSRTALHHATASDQIDAVRYLLEQICLDPYARDCYGRSCTDYARLNPSSESMRVFSQYENTSELI